MHILTTNIIGTAMQSSIKVSCVFVLNSNNFDIVEFKDPFELGLLITDNNQMWVYYQKIHWTWWTACINWIFVLFFEISESDYCPILASKDSRHIDWIDPKPFCKNQIFIDLFVKAQNCKGSINMITSINI